MPIGRTTTHRKITQMSDNTLTENEWLDLWEILGHTVKQYGNAVLYRVDGLTTELHESKITQMDIRNGNTQIQVDRYKAQRKPFRAQSKITFDVLATFLDTVVVLREIDRDVCENCECEKCLMVDLLAVGCIEMVKMLSAITVTPE